MATNLTARMRWFSAVTIVSLSLLVTGCSTAAAGSVSGLVNAYIVAEEQQDYSDLYSLFSETFKEHLRRDFDIRNGESYERLRRSSEARWFGFAVLTPSAPVTGRTAVVKLSATVEESGEREIVTVVLFLILEGEEWAIKSFDYY